MTPKEKAEELRQEFVFRIEDIIQPKTWDEVESLNTLIYKVAKECAELAVDEIIKIDPYTRRCHLFCKPIYSNTLQYWIEVKKEIEKL